MKPTSLSTALLAALAMAPATAMAQFYNVDCSATVDANMGKGLGGTVYANVAAAVSAIPTNNTKTFTVCVLPGNYTGRVEVRAPFVKIVGNTSDDTIISFNLYAGQTTSTGTVGTSGSATFNIYQPNFWAENVTIQNSWPYMYNLYLPKSQYNSGSQAVALYTTSNSNQASFYNVRLMGWQDTLYANAGSHYFHNCTIEGNVDFIFGAGQAVFDSCTIISLDKAGASTLLNQTGTNAQAASNGYLTAPSTQISNTYGFVFMNSKMLKNQTQLADMSVGLGRPWHPTIKDSNGVSLGGDPNAVGASTYMNCFLDSHIIYAGWATYSAKYANGSAQLEVPNDLSAARMFEYQNYGPGAVNYNDPVQIAYRRQLSDDQAKSYTISNVLGGWTPAYTSGKASKVQNAATAGAVASQWVAAAVVAAALMLL